MILPGTGRPTRNLSIMRSMRWVPSESADALGKRDVARDYQQRHARWRRMWNYGETGPLQSGLDVPGSWPEVQPGVRTALEARSVSSECARDPSRILLNASDRYELPLDSRKDYTKLDWELWTATLADKPEEVSTFHYAAVLG